MTTGTIHAANSGAKHGARWTRKMGAVALAAVVVIGGIAASSGRSTPSHGMTFTAEFADAGALLVSNTVKIHGVEVGTVSSVRVVNGKAQVKIHVNASALPLHQDARATVRPVSLLGEVYVDLDRGSPNAPLLANDGRIPSQQTGLAVGLDEVLNIVDDPTGRGLAALVTTLGAGLDGNGSGIDAMITKLASTMGETNQLVQVLKDQNRLLGSVVDKATPVTRALAANQGQDLDRLVGSATRLLQATRQNRQALEQTLADAPDMLAQARATLLQLSTTADTAATTLRSVRPTTDNLEAISEELVNFSDAASPALAALPTVLDKGRAMLDQARPVAAELKKMGPDLNKTVTEAAPIVSHVYNNLNDVFQFIRYWALTINGYDGVGHYVRAHAVIAPEMLTGLLPDGVRPEVLTHNTYPGTAGAPTSQPVPVLPPLQSLLPGVLQSLLPGSSQSGTSPLGSLLNGLGLPSTSKAPSGSATGLSANEESNLLSFLLGG